MNIYVCIKIYNLNHQLQIDVTIEDVTLNWHFKCFSDRDRMMNDIVTDHSGNDTSPIQDAKFLWKSSFHPRKPKIEIKNIIVCTDNFSRNDKGMQILFNMIRKIYCNLLHYDNLLKDQAY